MTKRCRKFETESDGIPDRKLDIVLSGGEYSIGRDSAQRGKARVLRKRSEDGEDGGAL